MFRLINCRFHVFRSSASCFMSPSSVFRIIKELRSSSFSFQYRHLSFNCIANEAISSENTTNPIGLSTQVLFRSILFSPILQMPRILGLKSLPEDLCSGYYCYIYLLIFKFLDRSREDKSVWNSLL